MPCPFERALQAPWVLVFPDKTVEKVLAVVVEALEVVAEVPGVVVQAFAQAMPLLFAELRHRLRLQQR